MLSVCSVKHAGKYVSFEEQINNYKGFYYEALKQSSDGWDTNENDYFPFIENFLSTLYMCYKELDKRFAIVNGKKITKKSRVEATVLNSLTPISKSEICKILPDVSPTTVEAVLGQMVKNGSIKKIGDDTGDIFDKMDLAEEDLDYLRRIADMEWKKEFTTANITFEVTNNNSLNNEQDIYTLAVALRDVVMEDLETVANGVYG